MAKRSSKTAHVLNLLTGGSNEKIIAPQATQSNETPQPLEPPQIYEADDILDTPQSSLSELLKTQLESMYTEDISASKPSTKQKRNKKSSDDFNEDTPEEATRVPYSKAFIDKFGFSEPSTVSPDSKKQEKEPKVENSSTATQSLRKKTFKKRYFDEPHSALSAEQPVYTKDRDSDISLSDKIKNSLENVKEAVVTDSSASSDFTWVSFDDDLPNTQPEVEQVSVPPADAKQATVQVSASETVLSKGTLHNIAEDAVFQKRFQVMEGLNMCTCPSCADNVAVAALNELPTMYSIIGDDSLETLVKAYINQYDSELETVLSRSCINVKLNNPHQ